MRRKVIREFEIEERTIPGGYYEIVIRECGRIIDEIREPTMLEALYKLSGRGYKER